MSISVNCAFLPWEKAKDLLSNAERRGPRKRGWERGSRETERLRPLGNFGTFVSKSTPAGRRFESLERSSEKKNVEAGHEVLKNGKVDLKS